MSFLTAGVGSVIGGVASGLGSLIGSSEAASASKEAAATQLQMYQQTRSDLSPYNTTGQAELGTLTNIANQYPTNYITQAAANAPSAVMTDQTVQNYPGYSFWLSQGLKSAQSSAAARGLGVSGASLKGASTYATGLADQYYQNAFNNAQTNFQNYLNLNTAQQGALQNAYTRAQGVASLGESAASQTGQYGTSAAATAGNYLSAAGQYNAAGTTGAGSAITGSINNYLGYNMLQQALQNSGTGGYNSPYISTATGSGLSSMYQSPNWFTGTGQ